MLDARNCAVPLLEFHQLISSASLWIGLCWIHFVHPHSHPQPLLLCSLHPARLVCTGSITCSYTFSFLLGLTNQQPWENRIWDKRRNVRSDSLPVMSFLVEQVMAFLKSLSQHLFPFLIPVSCLSPLSCCFRNESQLCATNLGYLMILSGFLNLFHTFVISPFLNSLVWMILTWV